MSKKKHISLLFMIVVAVAIMMLATQAMAGAPPTSCTFVAGTTTYTLSAFPAPNGTFPMVVSGGSGTQYLWAYQLVSSTGSLNGVGAMDGLVPVCDPDMGYAAIGGGQVIPPGKGDSSNNNYGLGDSNDFVMSMNAQSTSNSYGGYYLPVGAYVFATTGAGGDLQNTPMGLKIGTKTYYCSIGGTMAGIAGPSCQRTPDYLPVSLTENKQYGQFPVEITRDPRTRCIKSMKYFDTRETLDDGSTNPNYNTWQDSVPGPNTSNGHTVVSCGSTDGNQLCPECVSFLHSTRCYSTSSGGGSTCWPIPQGCSCY
jgi:hypothetical protein